MHEESLMRSLLRQIEELAEQHHAVAVEEIEVEVGPLSGVESLLLSSAFDRLKDATVHCSNATLTIQNVDLLMKCRDCDCEFVLPDFKFVCRQCGSISLKTLRGDALRLLNVQMEIEDTIAVDHYTSRGMD